MTARIYDMERERLKRSSGIVFPVFTRRELEDGCRALADAMGPLPAVSCEEPPRSWFRRLASWLGDVVRQLSRGQCP